MAETPSERPRPVAFMAWAGGASESALAGMERLHIRTWAIALTLIILLAAGLRLHGLRWDQPDGADHPLQMHPDERFLSLVADHLDWPSSLGQYFDTAHSPLNPYNDPDTHSFVYGTFPLFLAKGVSTVTGKLPASIGPIPMPNGNGDDAGIGNSYDTTVIWGRRLAATFDVGTVLLVFLLGSKLFSRKAGLVGALLYALAVLPTQLSHFWTMDPFLTFFTTATLLLACYFVRSETPRGHGAERYRRGHSARLWFGLQGERPAVPAGDPGRGDAPHPHARLPTPRAPLARPANGRRQLAARYLRRAFRHHRGVPGVHGSRSRMRSRARTSGTCR